ncbi:MAG: diaminopimelate epimerase [Bacteroidales bacterium]|nr:diaminopimelate epimerase [Bacteroidales bacterium]
MLVQFSKYHGTGNDFIMIDGRHLQSSHFHTEIIRQLCDRRFGVGGDGLIFLEKSSRFDFTMRYYNADGKEGTMCGNGGRCITAFARRLGITGRETVFEGIDGTHSASIGTHGEIRLKLADVSGIQQLEDGYLLNTGSPHFVILAANLEETDVEGIGAEIRKQKRFGPGGVNVNFLEADASSAQIAVRTFERGVEAETWSCGTGVTAAAITACSHFNTDIRSYQVRTRGGMLNVSFRVLDKQNFSEIYLTGPASYVYDGSVDIAI